MSGICSSSAIISGIRYCHSLVGWNITRYYHSSHRVRRSSTGNIGRSGRRDGNNRSSLPYNNQQTRTNHISHYKSTSIRSYHNKNNNTRSKSTTSSYDNINTNPNEVQKFSNMSNEWWDPKRNPLISMNPIRIQFIQQCIQQYYYNNNMNHHVITEQQELQEQQQDLVDPSAPTIATTNTTKLNILDIGCGGGLLSESIVRLGNNNYNVIGLDPSYQLIQIAQQHANNTLSYSLLNHLQYYNTTVQDYISNTITTSNTNNNTDNTDNQFDIICCLEVLEHIQDYQELLYISCHKLLKPNGLLFISTINQTYISYITTIIGIEYIYQLLPINTHDWNQYISPITIQHSLSTMNLSNNNNNNNNNEYYYTMNEKHVTGMVIPITSIPAIVLFNQWDWKLDPNNTNINWIGCYQKSKKKVI